MRSETQNGAGKYDFKVNVKRIALRKQTYSVMIANVTLVNCKRHTSKLQSSR